MVTPPTTTQLSFKAEDLPINSVTVFRPSGAQIIRILKANLKVWRFWISPLLLRLQI
jgi:hypothetical protein